MHEGYLDSRLIGRSLTVSEQNLVGYIEFYGIYYHLHSSRPLILGETVIVTAVDEHGITVVAKDDYKGEQQI